MKPKSKRRRCRHCGKLFTPDYRNNGRQRYCSDANCQRASKTASQRKWFRKPENLAHFRGEVEKTRKWRENHPGYWRRTTSLRNGDQALPPQTVKLAQESHSVPDSQTRTLQDDCLLKSPVFIGLLSVITGSTLQDDIAAAIDELIIRGRKILRLEHTGNDDVVVASSYEKQTSTNAQPNSTDPGKPDETV